MIEFETLVGLLLGAVILAAVARKVGTPFPPFSRSAAPFWHSCRVADVALQPDLALALFCSAGAAGRGLPDRDCAPRAGVDARASPRPSYAAETVVFAVNVLAFVFIGLQIRPILTGLRRCVSPAGRGVRLD
jgi:hypothetical protein